MHQDTSSHEKISDIPSPEGFLSHGLLPENLPPSFHSKKIWDAYSAAGGNYLVTSACVGSLSTYDASKRGGQRRLFSLPHPSFIHDQALFFGKNWQEVNVVYAKSPGSLSKPNVRNTGPRASRITPHSELPKARLKAFSRYKYCLITDIARFFPSIYSHSIPWAIDGREAAKADTKYNSASVIGNRLDFLVRQSQDRQTIGIAIGPDTSRLVSELVLCAVDDSFLKRSKKTPVYIRHVDDYWIAGNSFEECENHLRNLRTALKEFELDINELKTRIVPTNNIYGESWPLETESDLRSAFGYLQNDLHP